MIYDCDNNKYKYGEKIKIKGQLQAPKNSITFNYQNYLLSKNIHYIIYPKKITKLENDPNIFYKIKNKLNEKIENYQSKDYLKAFILGGTDLIDKEILESYRFNGISHLFAISGMHITLFSSFLFFFLSKIFSKRKSTVLISLFLLFYTFITNFSPSVIRAVFMFILINIVKQNLKILIFLFLLSILINPFNLYNLGFIFSYTVTFFLILFSKKINRKKSTFSKTITTSIIAFLASIPIMIKNFNYINLLSPLWNILLVPLVSTIIYPLSLITYLFKPLDQFLNKIMIIFEQISLLFEKVDLSIILKDINLLGLVLYFILIFLVIKNKKFVILLILIITLHTNINYIDKNAFITAIDVGQGDSILLKLPYNKGNILIDTGGNPYSENSIAKTRIIPYLKKEGIKKLDYLILTHGDFDHVGETINLIQNFKVNEIIMNTNDNNLEKKIKKNHKNVINVSKYTLNINGYKLKFINKRTKEENANSLIIYTKINNNHIILMGDAEKQNEDYILNEYNLPKMDILKVGHHGSNTSSSEKFIEKIRPSTSIISSGLNNRYGHPSEEVVKRLKKYGKVYNTAYDGTVKIALTAR